MSRGINAKNGIEDLRKAQHYHNQTYEVTEKEINANTAKEEKPEVQLVRRYLRIRS